MDNSQAPNSILESLRTVEFRLGLKGYNVDEVDEYLDKAAKEADGLQEHVRQLNDRLRQASERIAQLEQEKHASPSAANGLEAVAPSAEGALSDEALQRTLVLAQKFVDQAKRESEAEAATLIAQAQEKARTTVATAEQKAEQLQVESQKKVREDVSRLEATRNELASDVEAMARHLESERQRLRGTLSDLLKWLDENVQPAHALAGVKSKPGAPGKGNDAQMAEAKGLEAGGGPPTASLQKPSGTAVSGADRPR